MPEIHRATGKAVWFGKDLAQSTEWVYRFSDAALGEIDGAVTRLRKAGARLESITQADFALPTLAAHLKAMKEEVTSGRGFVVLRGLPRDRYSEDELGMIYWGVGTYFGIGIPQSFLGDRLGHIMDLSDEEPDATRRRAYHSGGPQRTHTDSGDIVSMLSLQQAKSGGESRLSSAYTTHNLMLDHCPDLLQAMYDGFYMREPDSDAEAAGRTPLSDRRIPTYVYKDGLLDCFYVGGFVHRAVRAGDITLSPREHAAMEAFAAFSNHPDVYLDMNLQPGDFQFLNNRKIMHGRAEFEDHPEKERRRHLLRLWLSAPDWPAIDQRQGRYSFAQVKPKQAVAAE